MAAVPPPFGPPPPGWSLNGEVMRARVPSTVALISAMVVPEDKGRSIYVTLACTRQADHDRVVAEVMGPRPPTPELFDDVADALVEHIVGWKRWEAEYLWDRTMGAWKAIDGEHLGRGVDLTDLPPGRATSAVFAWWRKTLGGSEDDWKRFQKELTKEPRRAIKRDAKKPMAAGDVAALQSLIGAAAKGTSGREAAVVPTSTITLP